MRINVAGGTGAGVRTLRVLPMWECPKGTVNAGAAYSCPCCGARRDVVAVRAA